MSRLPSLLKSPSTTDAPRRLKPRLISLHLRRGLKCVRENSLEMHSGDEAERGMSRFLPYSPEQAYLLPPSVKDELGDDHLCFFVHEVVEGLDLSGFEQAYSVEGGELYHPALMLKVWLYGYALGMTSGRRLEQRIREDLGLRFLAGGAHPDNWALSAFRRRHARGINDVITQVLELARAAGWGKLGRVAIDSTRIQAAASRNRIDTERRLREERARLRRQVRGWQKACDGDDSEPGGMQVRREEVARQLAEMPKRLRRLRKSGQAKLSRRDEEARFLRTAGGFVLGYTAEMAVSEDHLIVAQRVTQNPTDYESLLPLVEQVEQRCGSPPKIALADSGFYSNANIDALRRRGVEAYVPDSQLAGELNTGRRLRNGNMVPRHRELKQMRRKLRSPAGRQMYAGRKALVEPVWGVLKQQRGMRQFRLRGLAKVGIEMALAALAFNLTRMHRLRTVS
jgi:transposase